MRLIRITMIHPVRAWRAYRARRKAELVMRRVNEARRVIGLGLSDLGSTIRSSRDNLRVNVSVTSTISVSETLRRLKANDGDR